MNVVTVENLSKIYGKDQAAVTALGGVNLSVRKGEFVAIVGPSGSGKSTLLHLLGGVDRPTAGQVTIEDTDLYTLNESRLAIFRRRHIGLIYQFYNLIPVLNVEENLTLPQLLDGRSPDPERCAEILAAIGLSERRSHLPHQLSGGQQQRVAIGRALINNPAVLLADEPTGNLDRKTGLEVLELLKLSNKRWGQTLLMVTHDENIALQADRILAFEDGMIVRDEVIRS